MNRKIWSMMLMLVLGVLPLLSCSDDDDDSPTGGSGVFSATFTPDSGTPPPNSISMQPASSSGPSFTVNIDVTEVTDLYGVSYTLVWSPGILQYTGASDQASHLAEGGVTTSFQVALENGVQGRLVVGHTRVGQVSGVSGSGTLHSLSFRGVAGGNTRLDFSGLRLADSTGAVIQSITQSGGSATVTEQ